MKAIIHRDKQTKKIVNDFDEYDKLIKQGRTETEIRTMVEAYNHKDRAETVEIVEIDEVAEFYRTRKLNAYKDQLYDFATMENMLDDLSRMIKDYIYDAKKAYKEKQE